MKVIIKKVIFPAVMVSLCVCGGLARGAPPAIQPGINYSPFHSITFRDANSVDVRNSILTRDFNIIKQNGFSVVKTFYSSYSLNNGTPVLVAPIAEAAGIRVLLGVFEFQPGKNQGCSDLPTCKAWTRDQADKAIDQAKRYPNTIAGIVVGNEDVGNGSGGLYPDVLKRLADDMAYIKNAIPPGIPVLTAQRKTDWDQLAAQYNRYPEIRLFLTATDIIGMNSYPFWGGSPEKCGANIPNCPIGTSVAQTIPGDASDVLTKLRAVGIDKPLVITEEGWPSSSNQQTQNKDASPAAQADYYTSWRSRAFGPNAIPSMYFAMFDNIHKIPTDADDYFGLCEPDGRTKGVPAAVCY
jgi:exo-beta-1,3-glucanase (GH17 family)